MSSANFTGKIPWQLYRPWNCRCRWLVVTHNARLSNLGNLINGGSAKSLLLDPDPKSYGATASRETFGQCSKNWGSTTREDVDGKKKRSIFKPLPFRLSSPPQELTHTCNVKVRLIAVGVSSSTPPAFAIMPGLCCFQPDSTVFLRLLKFSQNNSSI